MKDYRNKELSWLAFNERVLQEAADPNVPLIERIKFLGIFSSNQDEFFRVRVATLKRLQNVGKKAVELIGHDPSLILEEIHAKVLALQKTFNATYDQLVKELEKQKIFIINETQLNEEQAHFVRKYFREEVRPMLIPIMIDQLEEFPELNDHSIYLAVRMWRANDISKKRYALIEVPTHSLPRFLILPSYRRRQFVILLDDVLRFSLADIFSMFKHDHFVAYTIKMTRDAELEFDDDLDESFMRKVAKSLKKRKVGRPVRIVFDAGLPRDLLQFILERVGEDETNLDLIPGARYHNFKDFINFPDLGSSKLRHDPVRPAKHVEFERQKSIFRSIRKQDQLVHYPYQSFDYVIDFLREAAIDPRVTAIKVTLYRLANKSKVVNALVNAAMNGKSVTVIMELQARFDEEANLMWSQQLQQAGIKVVHGVAGLKVHSKLLLVTRREKGEKVHYAHIGTGNFNESTARLYTDHVLFTRDKRLTKEVQSVFEFCERNYKHTRYKHLLVSPFNMRERIVELIKNEEEAAKAGKEAYIIAKLNNLTDPEVIDCLYSASQAGVKIKLLIRGMFSLVPGIPGVSDNIEAYAIIDRYLEHTRLLVFGNEGDPLYYLSSADWMPRNIDNRVEVATPVYSSNLKKEIQSYLDIHLQADVKTRILDGHLNNNYRPTDGKPVRAQAEIFHHFHTLAAELSPAVDSNGVLLPPKDEETLRAQNEPPDPSVV